jgi:hypothetical protein
MRARWGTRRERDLPWPRRIALSFFSGVVRKISLPDPLSRPPLQFPAHPSLTCIFLPEVSRLRLQLFSQHVPSVYDVIPSSHPSFYQATQLLQPYNPHTAFTASPHRRLDANANAPSSQNSKNPNPREQHHHQASIVAALRVNQDRIGIQSSHRNRLGARPCHLLILPRRPARFEIPYPIRKTQKVLEII